MNALSPLATLIVAALLSLNLSNAKVKAIAPERAVVVALEIEAAVEAAEAAGKLPVTGDAAKEGSALALAAIGFHESKFREDIADCRACDGKSALCDHGTSVTAYQMKKRAWAGNTKEQVCADGTLAAKLALSVLARHEAPVGGLFEAYARGGVGMTSRPAEEIKAIYTKLLRVARLRAVDKKRTEITFEPAKPVSTSKARSAP